MQKRPQKPDARLYPSHQLVHGNGVRMLVAGLLPEGKFCTNCEKTGIVLGALYGWRRRGQKIGAQYTLCQDCSTRIQICPKAEKRFLRKLANGAPEIPSDAFLKLPELPAGWHRATIH